MADFSPLQLFKGKGQYHGLSRTTLFRRKRISEDDKENECMKSVVYIYDIGVYVKLSGHLAS